MKQSARILISILVWIAFASRGPSTALGQNDSFANAASGKWETGSNWSAGVPSTAFTTIYITNASSKTVTVDANTPPVTISNLVISAAVANTNTLSISANVFGNPFDVLRALTVNSGGVVIVSNGTLQVDALGILGAALTMNGTMSLQSGGTLLVTNRSGGIGISGTGQATMASNSLWRCVEPNIGTFGTGTLTINGGTLESVGSGGDLGIDVAGSIDATGTVWVSGGTLLMTNSASTIGYGAGSMIFSNGLAQMSTIYVGRIQGPGYLGVNGGTLQSLGFLDVGVQGGTGDVFVTGGQLIVTNSSSGFAIGTIFLGENGLGRMTISNGTVIARNLVIATNSVARGELNLVGGTLTVLSDTNGFLVGHSPQGTGAVVVAGGQITSTNSPIVLGSLGAGVLTISNGTVVSSETMLAVGSNTLGSLQVAGGLMLLRSNLTAAAAQGSTGTINVTHGQLCVTNGVIGIGNDSTLTNGTGTASLTISNATVLAATIYLGSSSGGHGDMTIQTNGIVNFDSSGAGTNAVLVANDLVLDGGLLSMTNGTLYCGNAHPGAMIMSNGTAACGVMFVGYDNPGTMIMLAGRMNISSFLQIGQLAGSTGSVWMGNGLLSMTNLPTTVGNSGVGQINLSNGTIQASTIFIGNTGGPGGSLTVSGGMLSLNGSLGIGSPLQSTGTVWVSGGQLLVASGAITVGNKTGKGQFTISNGTVQANSLIMTNGTKSQFGFNGGTLISGGTSVTNAQKFLVGNGVSAATFNVAGGTHSFANSLEITNNGTLTGCGTINGSVRVDTGGRVVATCGTLTFTGIVTNNGTMGALYGSVLESFGPVVNNGLIDLINGGTTNFQGGFINNGVVLDASSVRVSTTSLSGNDVIVQIQSVTGHAYQLQIATIINTVPNWANAGVSQGGTGSPLTFTDPGGATNTPSRFYRIQVTAQ